MFAVGDSAAAVSAVLAYLPVRDISKAVFTKTDIAKWFLRLVKYRILRVIVVYKSFLRLFMVRD